MDCVHCGYPTEGTTTPRGSHLPLCPDCYLRAYTGRPGPPPQQQPAAPTDTEETTKGEEA
jgi:hypothetical protein